MKWWIYTYVEDRMMTPSCSIALLVVDLDVVVIHDALESDLLTSRIRNIICLLTFYPYFKYTCSSIIFL